MNKKNLNPETIIEDFLNSRKRHLYFENKRIADIYDRVPALKAVENERNAAGARQVQARLAGDPDALPNYHKKLAELNTRRAEIMQAHHLTAADFEIHYLCPDCHDTGYQGREVCHCLKQALTDAAFSRFDLSPRARLENFDTFELKYYTDDKPEHGPSPRRYMAAMKQLMMNYCADFEAQHDNYLFYGAPGLGKTFLSNCVANALIEKGKNVIYITAEHLINLVREAVRDGNDRTLSDSLSDCDLLIIDDLGAEYQTAFSDDQLFQIINDRILGDGPMLISSNLSPKEIQTRYNTRLASRMIGHFKALHFVGTDIRMIKKGMAHQ